MQTKRCEYLYECKVGISKDDAVACGAEYQDCPKSRLKCGVSQACWQVRIKK